MRFRASEFLRSRSFSLQVALFILSLFLKMPAKAATAQSQGEASRSLDSPLYENPPQPACDDSPSDDYIHQYKMLARLPPCLAVHCIHVETSGSNAAWPLCEKCIEKALERMWVVARRSVVFSLHEALAARGQTALFRGRDGILTSENFKTYGRAEVECALAALVAARKDYKAMHCHPLFVTQDPNL